MITNMMGQPHTTKRVEVRDYPAKIGRIHGWISRQILRMNKRLEKELGERVVERRGWHWALTSFAFETWGEGEENRKDAFENSI